MGVFRTKPFGYLQGDEKQLTDLNFEDFAKEATREISNESDGSIDAYCSSDEEEIDNVDFFNGVDNVVIQNKTTKDPFLNKLCSIGGHFSGFINELIPVNIDEDSHLDDPDASSLAPCHKV
ncbi:hypothetical protein CTI12_AA098660 [Artemisia annua]|uniref:Uncharacterized protein n=1 Tax=Artemisia annua TaxID=35608 RepID=A0A2U1PY71_ARTAN|nr:hypothetical protein CTI12_AA098660 [Artemisia annua]